MGRFDKRGLDTGEQQVSLSQFTKRKYRDSDAEEDATASGTSTVATAASAASKAESSGRTAVSTGKKRTSDGGAKTKAKTVTGLNASVATPDDQRTLDIHLVKKPSVTPSHVKEAEEDGVFHAPKDGMHELLEWGLLRPIPADIVRAATVTLFVISFFCGGGVGDHGFMMGLREVLRARNPGIRVVFLLAVEGDRQTAEQAARSWFKSTGEEILVSATNLDATFAPTYHQNPQFIRKLLHLHGYNKRRDKIVLLTTPPCQNASGAGARKEQSNLDGLSYTAATYVELLRKLEVYVNAVVYENVPGLRTKWDGNQASYILSKVARDLMDLGFAMRFSSAVEAANYGAPQFRPRLILLGFRGLVMSRAPAFTHTEDSGFNTLKLHDVVADNLFDRPDCLLLPFRGPSPEDAEAAFKAKAATVLKTKYPKVIVPTADRFATELLPTARATYPAFIHNPVLETCKEARDAVRDWPSRPCDERTHEAFYSRFECFGGTNEDCMFAQWGDEAYEFCRYLERGAPDGFLRTLTVTEFARTQGFPAAYLNPEWTLAQAYRIIGNAVNVDMASAIGRSVAEAVICTLARETGDETHRCMACEPLLPRLRHIDLGFAGELEPFDPSRAAATSTPYRFIEGEDQMPVWLNQAKSKLDKEAAAVPPKVGFIVPKSYPF
ncbi:S-adenosyl-L-methionine-dependent methyltransferase [Hyaloraphidium curvatum]|nr:S-adenosyl-L-methionine-dependent methyltransferase [Hyaloraphidium curvatum]